MSEGRARKWREKGWRLADKQPARNVDLWQRLLDLCDRHQVDFIWVEGHAGHQYNERCDELATLARQQPDLATDKGYEGSQVREYDLPQKERQEHAISGSVPHTIGPHFVLFFAFSFCFLACMAFSLARTLTHSPVLTHTGLFLP